MLDLPAGLADELREELLRAGQVVRGTVVGTSMAPFLRPGDRVVVGRTGRPVDVGDLVAFRREARWIVHRVLAREGDRLIEGGDNAGTTAALDPGDVLGVVLAVEREGRTLDLGRPPARRLGRVIAAVVHRAAVRATPRRGVPRRFRKVIRALAAVTWWLATREGRG